VVWQLLQGYAAAAGVPGVAPHDLRRSCAKMCRAAGGELEQIQLLLGHASVQTTERYLGTKQDLVHAPNDGIKLRLVVQALSPGPDSRQNHEPVVASAGLSEGDPRRRDGQSEARCQTTG
jgi:hypothetical protein